MRSRKNAIFEDRVILNVNRVIFGVMERVVAVCVLELLGKCLVVASATQRKSANLFGFMQSTWRVKNKVNSAMSLCALLLKA